MIKKALFYLLLSFFVACGSSKSIIKTTKSSTDKRVVRTIKKPVSKPVSQTNPDIKQETKSNNTQDNQTTEILEATTRVKVTTDMVLAYIDSYKEIAKQDMRQYGIPASITLGQGILESGAGTGPLSAQANNHFGIKCHKEWTGPSVKYDDDEAQECFRKYDNPNDSYRDHSLFLTSRPRYSKLFKLELNDYKSWARGLKEAGYATDSAYPTKLISLIERYQLQKYDAEVLGTDYVPTMTPSIGNATNLNNHEVVKGDTLYSISKKYNITIENLKKKNNIIENSISIGQFLIIK